MRFFTADHHFGHANILKYTSRPWDTLEEMHEELIGRWNNVVSDNDYVLVLGDFTYRGGMGVLADVVPRLNGDIALLCGNHDLPWIGHAKRDKQTNKPIQSSVDSVQRRALAYAEVGVHILSTGDPVDVWFSDQPRAAHMHHFPYEVDDRHGSRFIEYQMKNDGAWLLHGHVHEAWKVRGRQINVGVDVHPNYAPFSEDEILAIIARGPVLTEEAEVSP